MGLVIFGILGRKEEVLLKLFLIWSFMGWEDKGVFSRKGVLV